jgi:hypothetical protein
MQGKFIIGALFFAALGASSAAAVERPSRQTCAKGEQPQPTPQSQKNQQWAQQQAQQQRGKPQGCPVTRTIPSVVDPTPTFLL